MTPDQPEVSYRFRYRSRVQLAMSTRYDELKKKIPRRWFGPRVWRYQFGKFRKFGSRVEILENGIFSDGYRYLLTRVAYSIGVWRIIETIAFVLTLWDFQQRCLLSDVVDPFSKVVDEELPSSSLLFLHGRRPNARQEINIFQLIVDLKYRRI